MNVVVNGRFLERRITGVERYGREILSRLGNRPVLSEVEGLRVNGVEPENADIFPFVVPA